MKIVFMGTPDFAVPCLDVLYREKGVARVYTQPDKPKGRRFTMTPPPVKVYAQENGIPVSQPVSLKDAAVWKELQETGPDLIVVVAYGKILPKEILQIPVLGCINIHASVLPKYRGVAPIQAAILSGETETGITTMFMDEGIDTGDIILKKVLSIGNAETGGELHDRLSVLGAEALLETVALFEKKNVTRIKQDSAQASYTKPLKKEDGLLDWKRPAKELYNQIRGLNPWPCAYTILEGMPFKVHSALYSEKNWKRKPGTVLFADESGIGVVCGDGNLVILKEVQAAGGKKMPAGVFLNGHPFRAGIVFTQ